MDTFASEVEDIRKQLQGLRYWAAAWEGFPVLVTRVYVKHLGVWLDILNEIQGDREVFRVRTTPYQLDIWPEDFVVGQGQAKDPAVQAAFEGFQPVRLGCDLGIAIREVSAEFENRRFGESDAQPIDLNQLIRVYQDPRILSLLDSLLEAPIDGRTQEDIEKGLPAAMLVAIRAEAAVLGWTELQPWEQDYQDKYKPIWSQTFLWWVVENVHELLAEHPEASNGWWALQNPIQSFQYKIWHSQDRVSR